MTVEGFEFVWTKTLEGIESKGFRSEPSPELKPLLRALYEAACRRPSEGPVLDQAIRHVLGYLATPEGSTPDNCWVTSHFLVPGDEFWEEDWEELPDRFVEFLAIMTHELWQSVEDPEWSQTFGSMPEQLLREFTSGPGPDPS
jgi:hypothetical protein